MDARAAAERARVTLSELDQLGAVALDMRRRGLLVDRDAIARHRVRELATLEAAPEWWKPWADEGFQLGKVGSHTDLRRLFFERYGCEPLRKNRETGSPKLDAWTLQQYAAHKGLPISAAAQIVLGVRKSAKLLTTYLPEAGGDADWVEADGRFHPPWNVWGTITGRWSASLIQTIPKGLRNIFIAPLGWLLVAADYDKLELRIIAVLANDEALLRAFETGADVHRLNAAAIFQKPPELVTSQERDFAKRFVYAVNYGALAETVWAALVVDFPHIKLTHIAQLQRNWFAAHPAIRNWHVRTLRQAREESAVACPVGNRVEEFPDGQVEPNKVLNFPVQATGGYLANRAIVRWHEEVKRENLGYVTLQVHDELGGEFPRERAREAGRRLKEAMEQPLRLCGADWVFPAELKGGPSWGELGKLERYAA